MANTNISTAASTGRLKAACDFVVDLLDGGAGAGYIEIRNGTQPAGPGTSASGTLLATLPLSATAFGAATDASPSVATAAAITSDSSAAASGTATWFRAYDSNAVAIIDGDVSTVVAGTGDMQLDDTAIVAGGIVTISAWTYTQA